ncbi:MAG: DUF4340 domain-containing protein [Planctomycetota bacterium]|jgi:hypothetical protein
MNEITKTGIFVALGVAFGAIAWVAKPAARAPTAVDDSGERFFARFDPLEATSLEIVEFDEETATPQAFKVAQENGVWSIPSHESYPADAEDQLADTAAGIVDLVKGPTVSDRPADHELYGVIDPTAAGAGSVGVGTRVTLKDRTAKTLADLIVGKDVKDKPELRYVRVPDRARVYTAAVSTDEFSTRFGDWIERDLLELDPFEIKRVIINDYSIDEFRQRLIQGDVLKLDYDDGDRGWSLEGLGPDEALLDDKLDDMKRALDDLEIVDVHRKPAGLSAELRAEDQLVLDSGAVGSLQGRGFYILNGRLISNEGETIVGTAGGVQYTLRFGEIALGGRAEADEGSEEDSASSTAANRYLFVTAEFNANLVPAPELAELPDIPVEDLAREDQPDDAAGGQETTAPEDGETASTSPDQPTVAEALDMARKKIDEDNQRKIQEHEKKLAEGREKARALNDRFADWYYVISDSVYKKIRLRRSDLVEPAEEQGVSE